MLFWIKTNSLCNRIRASYPPPTIIQLISFLCNKFYESHARKNNTHQLCRHTRSRDRLECVVGGQQHPTSYRIHRITATIYTASARRWTCRQMHKMRVTRPLDWTNCEPLTKPTAGFVVCGDSAAISLPMDFILLTIYIKIICGFTHSFHDYNKTTTKPPNYYDATVAYGI